MGTTFMNTQNYKTNEPHRFRLTLVDKLNVKDHGKNLALVKSIYYTRKNIKSAYSNNELKSLLQLGMINFICLMDFILFQIFNIILSTILKNMKLQQIILLYKSKTGLF